MLLNVLSLVSLLILVILVLSFWYRTVQVVVVLFVSFLELVLVVSIVSFGITSGIISCTVAHILLMFLVSFRIAVSSIAIFKSRAVHRDKLPLYRVATISWYSLTRRCKTPDRETKTKRDNSSSKFLFDWWLICASKLMEWIRPFCRMKSFYIMLIKRAILFWMWAAKMKSKYF